MFVRTINYSRLYASLQMKIAFSRAQHSMNYKKNIHQVLAVMLDIVWNLFGTLFHTKESCFAKSKTNNLANATMKSIMLRMVVHHNTNVSHDHMRQPVHTRVKLVVCCTLHASWLHTSNYFAPTAIFLISL